MLLPSAFDTRTSFRAKWLPPDQLNLQETLSFGRSNLVSCERVAAEVVKAQKNNISVFDAQTSFRAKRLLRKLRKRKKRSVFDTRTSFRAKRWPYRGASSALPAALRGTRNRRKETVTEDKKREREKPTDQTERERDRDRDRDKDRDRDRETSRKKERKKEKEREDVKM